MRLIIGGELPTTVKFLTESLMAMITWASGKSKLLPLQRNPFLLSIGTRK